MNSSCQGSGSEGRGQGEAPIDGAIVVYDPIAHQASSPARTDELIVQMWCVGKSPKTQRAYRAHAQRLFDFTSKPLARMTLEDLQAFAAGLETKGLAADSRRTILAAIKSLFTFASDGGIRHLAYNVAAAIRLPRAKETLNERILSESQVAAMIDAARGGGAGRNRLIVEMLYRLGLRAEECVTVRWRDARADGDGGILTVFGKGAKTRHLRLDADTWAMLMAWRGRGAMDDAPIFPSRSGGALSTVQVWRIVSGAARAAGMRASPHWLRHAHSTHAIDHGCDLRTLQQSLGHASSETTERYVHTRPKRSSGAFIISVGSGDRRE